MSKKFSWPQQGHQKGMDRYVTNTSLLTDYSYNNYKDENDDNLHSNHDFAPYRSI